MQKMKSNINKVKDEIDFFNKMLKITWHFKKTQYN